MTTIADAKHNKLSTLLAKSGHTADLENEWLAGETGATGTTAKLWHQYLDDQLVVAAGQLNDRFYEWLGILGYSGSLNERWLAYWSAP